MMIDCRLRAFEALLLISAGSRLSLHRDFEAGLEVAAGLPRSRRPGRIGHRSLEAKVCLRAAACRLSRAIGRTATAAAGADRARPPHHLGDSRRSAAERSLTVMPANPPANRPSGQPRSNTPRLGLVELPRHRRRAGALALSRSTPTRPSLPLPRSHPASTEALVCRSAYFWTRPAFGNRTSLRLAARGLAPAPGGGTSATMPRRPADRAASRPRWSRKPHLTDTSLLLARMPTRRRRPRGTSPRCREDCGLYPQGLTPRRGVPVGLTRTGPTGPERHSAGFA